MGLVWVGRCVRIPGGIVVALGGKSASYAARISTTGEQLDSVRPGLHRTRLVPGDSGTAGGLQSPAADAGFSFTVRHILHPAGRADWRVLDQEPRLALGRDVRAVGARHDTAAGARVSRKRARGGRRVR